MTITTMGMHGQRRRERQVAGDAHLALDDVAQELGAGHERRRDVVTERQREREDRAGHDRRERERQDDPAERDAGARAQVARGLQQRVRDALEARRRWAGSCTAARGSVKTSHDRDVAVAGTLQAERLEHPVEDALLLEDRSPREDLDEVARPQRQQDARRRAARASVREAMRAM